VGDADGHRPSLGNDTPSTAQASGPTGGTSRSAIRRRTDTGSQVDWFTNCCRFCSLRGWIVPSCGLQGPLGEWHDEMSWNGHRRIARPEVVELCEVLGLGDGRALNDDLSGPSSG
jgi:hypothetical protein